MVRSLAVLAFVLLACDGHDSARDAATGDGGVDAATDAAVTGCDGGCAGPGDVCGGSDVDLDGGALPCRPDLVCCYPCGIPDCADRCIEPCTPGPGCQPGGCPGPFP